MVKIIKYISRINDDFDCIICGVNGVITDGTDIFDSAVEALSHLYLDGKKIVLATNSGQRVSELFEILKKQHLPMHIFSAMITAGELAHYSLKNRNDLGLMYYPLSQHESSIMQNLKYQKTDSPVLADFVLAETTLENFNHEENLKILEQAINLKLPMVCVGNNTVMMSPEGVQTSVGSLAEQYALMGGKIITFGKPDVRIAKYLTEGLNINSERCLVIGDNMATDMKMGFGFKAKNLLVCSGVHQIKGDIEQRISDLSLNYGIDIDFATENLQW